MRFRESLLRYALKHGVARACRKYNKSSSYIYFWRERWEKAERKIESLRGMSKRPSHHPNEHSDDEISLIKNTKRRNPNIGLSDLWHKLKRKGYKRSIGGLHKVLNRLEMATEPVTLPSPTYKPKPYEQMSCPGERVQIDVKFVPINCLCKELRMNNPHIKFYQYTAIDEYSRLRYLQGFDENSSYTAAIFIRNAYKYFKANKITMQCVQTDNGTEFTKRLLTSKKTDSSHNSLGLFEQTAMELGIKIKHIKPHTPKHNGKVERSHREDQKLLYSRIAISGKTFKNLDDFNKRLKQHQYNTNRRPMRPLGNVSPFEYLKKEVEPPICL
jgi:transposase InsO family protein